MTEEAKTTEPVVENTQTQTTQPEQSGKSIFDSFTAEDKAYLDKKGWTEENYVEQSLKAYRNLEKMMGGSKDIVEFPKEGDDEGFKNLFHRLGTPDSIDGYSYDVGEDKNFEATVGHLKDIALKSGMTKTQFKEFVEAFKIKDAEISENAQKMFLDNKKQALNDYANEKGKEFANIKECTDKALRMYGITEEERLGLENGVGIKRFYDLFGTIGKNLQEGNLITRETDSVTSTAETYKNELEKLLSDNEFMVRYMNGESAATAKVLELNRKISGGK
jgi:hypothetical protein